MASSFPVGRSPLPKRGGRHLSKPGPSKSPLSMIAREKLLMKLHSAGNDDETDLPDAEIPVNTDAGTLPHDEASSVPPAGLLLATVYSASSLVLPFFYFHMLGKFFQQMLLLWN